MAERIGARSIPLRLSEITDKPTLTKLAAWFEEHGHFDATMDDATRFACVRVAEVIRHEQLLDAR